MTIKRPGWKGAAMARGLPAVALLALLLISVATGYMVWTVAIRDSQVAEEAGATQLSWTMDDAKRFTEFDLYWLGDEFAGLPLTRIVRYVYEPPPDVPAVTAENVVLFIYGTCTPDPAADFGCPIPLSVRNEPYCMRPPSLLAEQATTGGQGDIRGAEARQLTSGDILLWTGDVRVSLLGEGLAASAGDALQAVNGTPGPGEPLPQPSGQGC